MFNESKYSKPMENKMLSGIKYTTNTRTCFDNTLVVKLFNQHLVMNVPAGIGISTEDSLSDKLCSKYIFSEKALKLKKYRLINSDKQGYLYSKITQ